MASAALSLNLERQVALVHRWYAVRETENDAWQETPFATDKWLRLTPDELAAFQRDLFEVLDRWGNRELPEDGRRRDPVFFFAHAVPAQP